MKYYFLLGILLAATAVDCKEQKVNSKQPGVSRDRNIQEDTLNKALQGRWQLSDNKRQFLFFKRDTVYSIRGRDTILYQYKTGKKMTVNEDTLEAKNDGEFIIAYFYKGSFLRYDYITGIDKEEFSLMAGSTLQPSVYIRKKF